MGGEPDYTCTYLRQSVSQSVGRVAKCHRYGRYICVKILEGWGKKCRRPQSFIKLCLQTSFLWSNFQPFFLRGSHLSQFHSTQALNLSQFTRSSWGKDWFARFDLCKTIDISQVWICVWKYLKNIWEYAIENLENVPVPYHVTTRGATCPFHLKSEF